MKKFSVLCTLLVLVLFVGCFGSVILSSNEAEAKSIYFAGKYEMKKGGDIYDLDMSQYSSPEGKEVGNFTLTETDMPASRIGSMESGTLKRIGKNKYRYKKGKLTLTFKVYKKKVKVTQKGKGSGVYRKNVFTGTYKLKKRYYS